MPTYQPIQRFSLSRWLHQHGFNIERQLLLVQWALPLFLTAIVLVYEMNEHIFTKHESYFSPNFLGEIFFFGVLGPMVAWLVLWWVRGEWQEREQDKQALQRMYNELAEAQERLNMLYAQRGQFLNYSMSVNEAERRRLAREIHDELGQMLTGLSLNLKLCQEAVPAECQTAHEYLSRAQALVRDSIDRSHDIIANLRPPVLDDLGLVAAVQDEIHRSLDPLGLDVDFQVDGLETRLPPAVESAVFRIVQEAFSNIVRHAHARHVRVCLSQRTDQLHVTVEDDGVGIPQNVMWSRDGHSAFGFLGMRERATALGGQIVIEPRSPTGTSIRLMVPLGEKHV